MDRLGACFKLTMNSVISNSCKNRPLVAVLALAVALFVAGCSEDSGAPLDSPPTGDFELRSLQNDLTLIEGDDTGLSIPLALQRQNGHENPVELSLAGVSADDTAFISSSFTQLTLTPNADESQAVLKLAIADLPLLPQQRQFIVTASDGIDQDEMLLNVNVVPVAAPDIYLLVGQSNMVGFSGDGTRQAYAGGADETNPRIKQLNVSKNDRQNIFLDEDDFSSSSLNVVQPAITTAEDPLHVPLDPSNTTGKDLEYIGLGLSFAKAALNNTSQDIVLVPAAWSGTSFCIRSPLNAKWNAVETSNPALGNTLLFERALARLNLTLLESGGIFRGILWHQGETDADEQMPACSELYRENIQTLAREIRTRARVDQRGQAARGPDADIPFVVGTMSRGVDENGSFAEYSDIKQTIDNVHRSIDSLVPHSAVSNHDDLVPPAYPCGNDSCIHFGSAALREMGRRYYDALQVAAQR